MSPEDWEDIQYLIRFPSMTREARAELPAGVAIWLMPTAITLDHVRNSR